MRSTGLWLAAIVTALFPSCGAAEILWQENYYNPSPLPDDLVLPMPCGGAMVFRPIETPSPAGVLDDVSILVGQETNDLPFLHGLHRRHISGPFPATAGKSKFYMAKYELAEAQFTVLNSSACPERIRRRDFRALSNVSKQDLDRVADRYTGWLLENAPDSLPVAFGIPGFLRLPTEAEWEYSARGGDVVAKGSFRNSKPPIQLDETYDQYIAHVGTSSTGGKRQQIGTLKPNAVGLHDMLGNVAEFTGNNFSLVRPGRPQGMVGGNVKRGGDFKTALGNINSWTRLEVAPFDIRTNQPYVDDRTGGRLVISAPILQHQQNFDEVKKSYTKLLALDSNLPSADAEEEIIGLLVEMIEESTGTTEQQRLELIKTTIESVRVDRNSQRDSSIKMILQSSALMCESIINHNSVALTLQGFVNLYEEYREQARAVNDVETLAIIEADLTETQDKIETRQRLAKAVLLEYSSFVEGLAGDYSAQLLGQQLEIVVNNSQDAEQRRQRCLEFVKVHILSRSISGFADLETWALDFQNEAIASIE